MPTVPLPNDPNLEQLRKQAKDLQRGVRSGDAAALALADEHGSPPTSAFALSSAQLVLARMYGFASWPRLMHHVQVVERFGRGPDDAAASTDPADEFLRLACLAYGGDDGPVRWAAARALLAAEPSIATANVFTAAATADVLALRRLLAADATLASSEGGPHRWQPLLYLAYARHDIDVAEADVAASVALLLESGADPNAGYLWHGMPSPFTALTGAFGSGELGPASQPQHPHGVTLARLLLEAGADPNDAQALYNRMFEPNDEHLALLFEFGLGQDSGGPWRERLGDQLESPASMLRGQLRWAIDHGIVDRVRLLASNGVDIRSPFTERWYGVGRSAPPTPAELAAMRGQDAVVEVLVGFGAEPPALQPVDTLIAAALRGDRAAVERAVASDPDAVAAARQARRALIVQAASQGNVGAVRLLAELGFDVNAMGRGDTPSDQPWETALHTAISRGDADMVVALVALGADPTIHDARFDGTAYDWADHFHRPDLAALLPSRS
jgi:hypothetical protein